MALALVLAGAFLVLKFGLEYHDDFAKHLFPTDVPYGVLLSGGLDSSLVAACAAQFARERVEDDDRSEAWWPRLHL